ncbi:MAG: hypothetical protein JW797_13235 [Bradymonadales bacterium]|nr:hypothetical protein [Bradymonadales bacterium]
MKYEEFEQKLLLLATQTGDPLTPAFVGLKLGIRIQDASKMLDQMTLQGLLNLDSDDEGRIHYEFPGIRRPEPSSTPGGQLAGPIPGLDGYAASDQSFNPAVAGLMSLILPGSGQFYRQEYKKGALFLVLAVLLYGIPIVTQNLFLLILVVPALVVHIMSVAQAAKQPQRFTLPLLEHQAPPARTRQAAPEMELDQELERELAALEEKSIQRPR